MTPKVYQASYDQYIYDKIVREEPTLGKVISPSYLKQKQALSNAQFSYEFDLLSSNPVSEFAASEVKLNDKDLFIATGMAACLANVNTTLEGTEILFAYPNSEAFATTGATAAHLQAFYNGHFSVMIDQTEIVSKMPAYKFLEVPETYQEIANLTLNHDSVKGFPGQQPLSPAWLLNGKQEIKITWKVPQFTATAGFQTTASNRQIRAHVILTGFIVKGGAQMHYDAINRALSA